MYSVQWGTEYSVHCTLGYRASVSTVYTAVHFTMYFVGYTTAASMYKHFPYVVKEVVL